MNFSIKISVSSPRVAWRFDDARSCLTTGKWVIYCPRSSKLVLLFIFFIFSFLFFLSLLLPRQPRLAVPTNTKRPLSRNNFSGLGASSCHVSHGGVVPRVAYIRKKPNAIKRSLRISQFASQTNERRKGATRERSYFSIGPPSLMTRFIFISSGPRRNILV